MAKQTPHRIQVRRTKGFRLPADTVYVGRPTKWGNPFRPGPDMTRAEMVAAYRRYLRANAELMAALPELRGRNLACWCRLDEPCHADVLLELANGPPRRKKAAP
jgi:hypothetical protein